MRSFKVSRGEKRGTLNVTCPSRPCGGKFVVSRAWAKGYISSSGQMFETASCPYCFKTAIRRTA